ncbi:MAG: type II secretion system F family protein [Candidatus Aenigmatarchaeota archaeon]|nr:MAG: type II secretion system F family protein [Candidatus Aenigmarchaeota archaeon]
MIPPFPIRKTLPFTRRFFRGPAAAMVQLSPSLKYYLDAIHAEETADEYATLGLANAVLMGSLAFLTVFSLAIFAGQALQFFGFSLIAGLSMGAVTLLYWMSFPKVQAHKRAQLIDRELLFALRDISVELDAGMSFVDSLDLLTEGYGHLSEEMNEIVKDIRIGTPLEDAMERSMRKNTSKLYKSAMLRIFNGIRSGADIPTLLSVVIENLTEETKAQVKAYGQEINLWATLYLMVGIVLPSMGLTLMVMLSTFTGLAITESLVYMLTFFLLMFHASAIGFLRSRRPLVEV